MTQRDRLLVVGLDGATFDVLDPLFEAGRLPNLQSLVDQGFRTPLQSTYPPVTGPAWTTLATGLDPGNTGAFDFLNRTDPDDLERSFIDASYFEGRAFWDYLSADGIRSGVVNYPMLYPPYELEGFMVSGIGGAEAGPITFPPELHAELDEVTGGYPIGNPSYMDPVYEDAEEFFLEELRTCLDGRIAAATHLVEHREWDVFFVVFSASDLLQHYLWKHWDGEHPDHEPGRSDRHRSAFVDVWERLDDAVGDLVALAGEETDILVLSDHGFGPQTGCFEVNAWLREEGFLQPNEVTDRSALAVAEDVVEPVVRAVSDRAYTKIRRFLGERVGVSRPSMLDRIDRDRSRAVCLSANHNVASIFVLDDDRERVRSAIERRLEAVSQSDELSVTVETTRPEAVYHGEKLALAPDLLLHVDGYETAVARRSFDDPVYRDEPFSPNQTGLHRRDGVLLGAGPRLASSPGSVKATLADVAPTILRMYGYDPGDRKDGQVLGDLLAIDEDPTRSLPTVATSESRDGDDDAVREQLEDLGYL